MPYSALVLFSRKPGVSPKEFEEYFESHQVPHLKSTAGEGFPVTHTRVYLQRSEEGPDFKAVILPNRGSESDFPFDGLAIMEFEHKAHADLFLERTHTDEQLSKFQGNPLLPDRTKARAVMVSGVYVTKLKE